RLEHDGLLATLQGSGTFVPSAAPLSANVSDIAAGAALQAYECRVSPRDVAAALFVTPEPADEAGGTDRARRQQLRAQISALQSALGEIEAQYPAAIPAPAARRRGSGPRLLTDAELEEVRTALLRRLATIQAA